jgi:hypothetical protein
MTSRAESSSGNAPFGIRDFYFARYTVEDAVMAPVL